VGEGHAHRLYQPAATPVHALPAECKLLATFTFVLVVVLTPREWFGAFAGYAALLAGTAALARVRAGVITRRMLIEIPFVAFALLLPFVARGEQVAVAGVALSQEGLLGAWNILAKGTLGVVSSILLSATTDLRSLLIGLNRLHIPPLLVQIMTFMIRYGDVIVEEMRRMHVARASRGFQARGLRQLPVLARSAGALFIRSYERGERVHRSMLARGYDGRLPATGVPTATAAQWAYAFVLPAVGLLVALTTWGLPMWRLQ
jgi:cobalt/nickel transport system permease protein